MASRKKPWNAGKDLFPGLRGEPPPKPAPLEPGPVTPGTSSLMGDMRLECARCERIKLGNDPKGLDHIPSCSFRGTGKDPEL